jgi:hypothetical protein
VIYILLAVFCLSFLLVQKRNKKRPPKTKQPVFGKVFQLSVCGTVVNYSGPLIASPAPTLEAQTVQINKHEKQMQKSK